MNYLTKTGARLFSLLLQLYPADFRDEFGGEMQGVFEEKIAEEHGVGTTHRIFTVFCELRDLTVRALAERMIGWKGRQQPMTIPIYRLRLMAILSPIILTIFLLVINPRYLLRFFSDPLGWEIAVAVLLGLCISLMIWSAPSPSGTAGRLVEETALLISCLILNLMIILGPALVMAFGSSSSFTVAREYASNLQWIMLAIDGILLIVAVMMGVGKIRRVRSKAGG